MNNKGGALNIEGCTCRLGRQLDNVVWRTGGRGDEHSILADDEDEDAFHVG